MNKHWNSEERQRAAAADPLPKPLYRLVGVFRWFWPRRDRLADWSILRRLIILISVGVALAAGGWVLVSELQKQRFDRELLDAALDSSAEGIGRNIAVMDYGSAAFLASAYSEYSHVLALQITDRYGFLIYGPEEIDAASFPANAVVTQRQLVDEGPNEDGAPQVVGMLQQVVAAPSLASTLLGVLWKGIAAGLIFGTIVAATIRSYIRRYVVEPLERLTEAVAKTSETGEITRVTYLPETQFGIFARNFNRMQDKLEDQVVALQNLIKVNSTINNDLRQAYERYREAQRLKLAQFDALGRALHEAQIVLTYVDRSGKRVFGNASGHPVQAIDEVLQKDRFDADEIIAQLTSAGLICNFVGNPGMGAAESQGGFEIEVLTMDGQAWVLFAGPRDVDGQVVLCTNISNLHEMQRQLRQKQKLEALGTLVGGVAHEFNNMLAIILGNLELMEAGNAPTDEARQEMVATAQRAAERAAATVAQLLDFARQRMVARQTIEIDKHFEGLTNMLRGTLGPGIRLGTQIEPGIIANIDPGQLDGAIINLATNARDAMNGAGKLDLRVYLQTEAQQPEGRAEYCVIELEDSGPGVPIAIRHKIFEPFFSTKAEAGAGVGLGLASIAGFVETCGGTVDIRTGRGGGALFVLKLPTGAVSDTVDA